MLTRIISKIVKLVGIGFLLPFTTELANAQKNGMQKLIKISNPYSDPRLSVLDIKPALSLSECEWEWGRTMTTNNPDGTLAEKKYEKFCLRSMSFPDKKYFKRAIIEGARAIRRNHMDEFDAILNAWPREMRKELHDKAFARAKVQGARVTSTMPAWQDGSVETVLEQFRANPYHMMTLSEERQAIEVAIASPSGSVKFSSSR